jgi:modulator of FtsH protease HflK
LNQVFESAMREAVGQASLDKALAFDPSITFRARDLMQRTLVNYGVGINIVAVKLNEVGVPEAVQEAQRDAIKADKDRQRYQQEAEIYRNDVCRGRAARPQRNSRTLKRTSCRSSPLAQGETSRFDQVLAQYDHAPGVTRERMYLETMENVYKNSRKVFMDTKAGGNNMIYLPLDKLIVAIAAIDHAAERYDDRRAGQEPEVQVSPPEDPARARGVR